MRPKPPPAIQVTSSPTNREKGAVGPAAPPADDAAWEALRQLDRQALKEIGLRPWNDPLDPDPEDIVFKGKTLMLLPGEWYRHIPTGYELIGLHGEAFGFMHGVTDDKMRFGCLPYGLLV